MKKLPKKDVQRRDELATQLDDAHSALEESVANFNGTVTVAWTTVEEAMETYNAVVQEIEGFKSDIASEIESYVDARSEKWQEGDGPSAYDEWKSAFEEELTEVDLEQPEDVTLPEEVGNGDTTRELPEEVSL